MDHGGWSRAVVCEAFAVPLPWSAFFLGTWILVSLALADEWMRRCTERVARVRNFPVSAFFQEQTSQPPTEWTTPRRSSP